MSHKVLQFNNVSKLYTLGAIGSGTLGRDLARWWTMKVRKKPDPLLMITDPNCVSSTNNEEFVWALQDVTFSVNHGDVVGIIGKNGSGKSTLLKILSRITAPTSGTIDVKGKVASLLEVGTGFHQDLTGRENIYMNGAILGMTKAEITQKFDDIVSFSGIEQFIDTPVKRYSSGMKVRLGFAVAAFLDPDILIVDEVLAVGDAEFQKRAIGKMQSISKDQGRTVLFVSHNMNAVMQLCNRGIILDRGRIIYKGNVSEAVANYLGSLNTQAVFEGINGDPKLYYLTYASASSNGNKTGVYRNCDPIDIEFDLTIKKKYHSFVVAFNLYSQYDYPLARTDYNDVSQITTLEPGDYRFKFTIPPYTLANGTYRISFAIGERKKRGAINSESDLSFDIVVGDDNFGNVFPDITPRKNSIIHENWFREFKKL